MVIYGLKFSDGSMYIGKTRNLRKRINSHRSKSKSSENELSKKWQSFGEPEMTILADRLNDEGARRHESKLIRLIKPSINKYQKVK